MCKLTYWVNNKAGFIATCETCGHYHVAFGTAMVVMDKKGFQEIARQVSDLLQGTPPAHTTTKYTALPTGCRQSYLVLSWQEATALHELIESAATEMTTRSLIHLLENG